MTQLSLQQALDVAIQHHRAGSAAEAESIYRQILAVFPDEADVHNNLGNLLESLGRLDEAIACCTRAVALRPDFAEAHDNLGNALRRVGKIHEAIAAYRRALSLRPDFPHARNNLGLSLLLLGDYEQGWALFESRWQLPGFQGQPFSQPRWDGGELNNRRILLHTEQGFGDAIQFARYIPLVIQRGGRVVLACRPEMLRLMQSIPGVEQFLTQGDPLPLFEVHCPLMSLPHAMGTTVATIPATVPYLRADQERSKQWQNRIAGDRRLKVGLAWSGRPVPDPKRSIPAEELAPLSQIPDVRFFSLQKPDPAAPIRSQPPIRLDHWTTDLHDFADTAAVIDNLDLVISIDTAVAHLAGAMGKPVWLLLPHVPDWRWMLERTDSPWYPTMRIFRQERQGEWGTVIGQVCDRLRSAGR